MEYNHCNHSSCKNDHNNYCNDKIYDMVINRYNHRNRNCSNYSNHNNHLRSNVLVVYNSRSVFFYKWDNFLSFIYIIINKKIYEIVLKI